MYTVDMSDYSVERHRKAEKSQKRKQSASQSTRDSYEFINITLKISAACKRQYRQAVYRGCRTLGGEVAVVC